MEKISLLHEIGSSMRLDESFKNRVLDFKNQNHRGRTKSRRILADNSRANSEVIRDNSTIFESQNVYQHYVHNARKYTNFLDYSLKNYKKSILYSISYFVCLRKVTPSFCDEIRLKFLCFIRKLVSIKIRIQQ